MKLPQMKSYFIFLLALLLPISLCAQHPVAMRNLWARPQVHAIFNEYTLSFTIKDIDKSLALLRETGDNTHELTCGLDTAQNYTFELFPGSHAEYRYPIQAVLQNLIGCFLLTAGHAEIKNKRNKVLKEVIVDIEPLEPGDSVALVSFYDPKTKAMVFQGRLPADLYKKDLGIDD